MSCTYPPSRKRMAYYILHFIQKIFHAEKWYAELGTTASVHGQHVWSKTFGPKRLVHHFNFHPIVLGKRAMHNKNSCFYLRIRLSIYGCMKQRKIAMSDCPYLCYVPAFKTTDIDSLTWPLHPSIVVSPSTK
jgi:hypothetical protein